VQELGPGCWYLDGWYQWLVACRGMWGYDWVVSTGRRKERVMSEGVGTRSARVADLLEATGDAFASGELESC